jgi:DNA polymerase-1
MSNPSLKLTPGGKVSTGKGNLELLKEDPVVQDILEYRQVSKLLNTYVHKLPRIARFHPRCVMSHCPECGLRHKHSTMRIHTRYSYTRTSTGRAASSKPNLQNIPIRTDLGREVRGAFIPSPGYKLVSADYSQIELRVLADHSMDPFMLKCFEEGLDLHTATAQKIMVSDEQLSRIDPYDGEGHDTVEVDKDQRRAAKTVNFGIVYGMTPRGLQAALILMGCYWTLVECEKFIVRWYQLFQAVKGYMDEQYQRAYMMGFTWDMWGGVRYIPEVRSMLYDIRMAGERQAGNLAIQSGAGGILKVGSWRVWERQKEWNKMSKSGDYPDPWAMVPLLTIHDQLVEEVEEGRIEEGLVGIVEDMKWVNRLARLKVPIEVDGDVQERWLK